MTNAIKFSSGNKKGNSEIRIKLDILDDDDIIK